MRLMLRPGNIPRIAGFVNTSICLVRRDKWSHKRSSRGFGDGYRPCRPEPGNLGWMVSFVRSGLLSRASSRKVSPPCEKMGPDAKC